MKNLFRKNMGQDGKGQENVRENFSCIRVEKFRKVFAQKSEIISMSLGYFSFICYGGTFLSNY